MLAHRLPGDLRSDERIRDHYTIEKAIAERLRRSQHGERAALYSALYDELFRRVPDHPQLTQKRSADMMAAAVQRQLRLFAHLLKPETVFMEIGPGDCAVSFAVARQVARVVGIDVSAEITRHPEAPANFELILSDGSSVPVAPGSIDVVYSNQLMEHLHPDDARMQLAAIARALRPGGAYVCVTPSALSGPHDVSRHFDDVATGLHLREYTHADLVRLFTDAGFTRIRAYAGGRGRFLRLPLQALLAFERLLTCLPATLARRIGRSIPGQALLGVRLIALRPPAH